MVRSFKVLHAGIGIAYCCCWFSRRGRTLSVRAVSTNAPQPLNKIVVGTRLHLGRYTSPPTYQELRRKISNFADFCNGSFRDGQVHAGVVAVDAAPKFDEYDLVQVVQDHCRDVAHENGGNDDLLRVLPVTPWNVVVPSLNALTGYAAAATEDAYVDCICFVSAETTAPKHTMDTLLSHMNLQDTLVVGSALSGHEHFGSDSGNDGIAVDLDGTTCPWNTLALWNLRKLALTGFQLVSEGYLTNQDDDPSYGMEEVVAVCLLQRLLGVDNAKAKLVRVTDEQNSVIWDVDNFDNDAGRQQWHRFKMETKKSRAARQLQLTDLKGTVYHY